MATARDLWRISGESLENLWRILKRCWNMARIIDLVGLFLMRFSRGFFHGIDPEILKRSWENLESKNHQRILGKLPKIAGESSRIVKESWKLFRKWWKILKNLQINLKKFPTFFKNLQRIREKLENRRKIIKNPERISRIFMESLQNLKKKKKITK